MIAFRTPLFYPCDPLVQRAGWTQTYKLQPSQFRVSPAPTLNFPGLKLASRSRSHFFSLLKSTQPLGRGFPNNTNSLPNSVKPSSKLMWSCRGVGDGGQDWAPVLGSKGTRLNRGSFSLLSSLPTFWCIWVLCSLRSRPLLQLWSVWPTSLPSLRAWGHPKETDSQFFLPKCLTERFVLIQIVSQSHPWINMWWPQGGATSLKYISRNSHLARGWRGWLLGQDNKQAFPLVSTRAVDKSWTQYLCQWGFVLNKIPVFTCVSAIPKVHY